MHYILINNRSWANILLKKQAHFIEKFEKNVSEDSVPFPSQYFSDFKFNDLTGITDLSLQPPQRDPRKHLISRFTLDFCWNP